MVGAAEHEHPLGVQEQLLATLERLRGDKVSGFSPEVQRRLRQAQAFLSAALEMVDSAVEAMSRHGAGSHSGDPADRAGDDVAAAS